MVKLFEIYCRLVLRFYAPVKVSGNQSLPNRPFIMYSNHSSHLDFIILSLYGGKGFKNTCVIAAQDYWFDNRWRRRFIEWFFNGIPVNRRKLFKAEAIKEIIDLCRTRMDRGSKQRSLIVFPEGRRSSDGTIEKFKIGPAAIASELGIAVVPAYIKGSHLSWPKGRWFMAPRKIELFFGEPLCLDTDDIQEKESLQHYRAVTGVMEAAFHKLRAESTTKSL